MRTTVRSLRALYRTEKNRITACRCGYWREPVRVAEASRQRIFRERLHNGSHQRLLSSDAERSVTCGVGRIARRRSSTRRAWTGIPRERHRSASRPVVPRLVAELDLVDCWQRRRSLPDYSEEHL